MSLTLNEALEIIQSHFSKDLYDISVIPCGDCNSSARIVVTKKGTYSSLLGISPLVRRSRCLSDLRKRDKSAALDDARAARGQLTFLIDASHPVFTNWAHVRAYVRSLNLDRDRYGVAAGPYYEGSAVTGVAISAAWATAPTTEEVAAVENSLRRVLKANGVHFKLENVLIPARPPLVHKAIRKIKVVLPLLADGFSLVLV